MANILTLSRIALIIPLIMAFLAEAPWGRAVAFWIFAIAALTDFADGWVARARNETSSLGAALDPIADKLLVAIVLILAVRNGLVYGAGVIAVLIVVAREILVSGLREATAAKKIALPVSRLAKWKTFAQLLAAGLLLAAAPGSVLGMNAQPTAMALLWIAALLTLWTGAQYCVRAAKALSVKTQD
ncbi:MAG: CDP-diacylglycerol--glycerol-3-phosphate 3-phosphatidyltransferase [Pseudomonadota bacterium]